MAAFRECKWSLPARTGCPYTCSIGQGWGGEKKKEGGIETMLHLPCSGIELWICLGILK